MKCTKMQLSENFEKSKFIKFLQIVIKDTNARYKYSFQIIKNKP
mgnify:CR=1 FL=1